MPETKMVQQTAATSNRELKGGVENDGHLLILIYMLTVICSRFIGSHLTILSYNLLVLHNR